MVAHGGKLYRIGGFTAKNKEGEKHDLWSKATVDRYDPATEKWQTVAAMPEPRSSFDAAVIGDRIFVVGGWQMNGAEESKWSKSAFSIDLAKKTPKWEALSEPPFQRRALSVAAHDGRIYAIGGMQKEGGPTTAVDVFDVAKRQWSKGPNLHGEPMNGFGSSAFATNGRLYVSTYDGTLQRLTPDGTKFEIVKQMDNARFFHRMLPLSKTQLLTVGGASMQTGKFDEVEIIDVGKSP
jgi:N-acetylneuraminic acid mutarotase